MKRFNLKISLTKEQIIEKFLYLFIFILPFENGLLVNTFKLPEFLKFRYLYLFLSFIIFFIFLKKITINRFDYKYVLLYIIFFAIILVSSIINYNNIPHTYPFYNQGYMYAQGTRTLYLALIKPLFFLLFSITVYLFCINAKKAIKIIFKTFIIVGVISSLYGLYQFIGYKLGLPYTSIFSRGDLLIGSLRRCEGIFYEPGPHSKFLSICFFLLIADILNKNKFFYIFKSSKIRIFNLIVIVMGMILTISPIGFIAPIFLLFLFLFNFKATILYLKKNIKKVISYLTIIIILSSLALFVLSQVKYNSTESLLQYAYSKIIMSVYSNNIIEYYNPDSRTLRTYVGLSIFKDFPILGCGAGNSTFLYYKYIQYIKTIIPIGDGVINQNINFLAEFGLIGFLSYLSIILYPFYKYLMKKNINYNNYKIYIQLLLITILYFVLIVSFGNLFFFEIYFWFVYISTLFLLDKSYQNLNTISQKL